MNNSPIETYPVSLEKSVVKQTANELSRTMNGYVESQDIRELMASVAEDRNAVAENEDDIINIEDIFDPDMSEERFMELAQRILEFRKGADRTALESSAFKLSDRTEQALESVKLTFHMSENTEPADPETDAAVVPGSRANVAAARLKEEQRLEAAGLLNTDMLILIGSQRSVYEDEIKSGRGESTNPTWDTVKTEFDAMRAVTEDQLHIDPSSWMMLTGYDSSIPEQHRYQNSYQIAYTEIDGKHVFVLDGPMIGEDRLYADGNRRPRSNTGDGYLMIDEMRIHELIRGKHEDSKQAPKIVSVTDAIYAPFQGADAKAYFGKRGIRSETVGFTRKHAGLPEWRGGSLLYIQETLSALRQTRAARDELEMASKAA